MSALRAFVAVELPDPLRHALAKLQTTLRATRADVAWVAPANLHFTLKFLGAIDAADVDGLAQALREAMRGRAPFPLTVEGIGAFPGTRNPRIIWVGATGGAEALTAIAEAVERACVARGLPAERRPFAAHLTLGRVRSRAGLPALVKALQTVECHGAAPISVDQITLFQSTLSSRGAVYTPLAAIPLAVLP